MTVRRRLASGLNALLGRLDMALVRRSELERLRRHAPVPEFSFRRSALPPGAAERLRPDHPRLAELRARYGAFKAPVMARSLWTDAHAGEIPLAYFRGDNPIVWQLRENVELQFLLTAYHAMAHDPLGVLDTGEDELFGIYTFEVNERLRASRDLLDSTAEISFLEGTLGLRSRPGLRILDIGAGYGRLAHRLVRALPDLGRVTCADAVAESTFLCEFYLAYRGLEPKARAVPVDEIERAVTDEPPDLAINVRSFSECPLEAIRWWIDLLARNRVRSLFVAPNADEPSAGGRELRSREPDGARRDLLPLLASRGYRRVALEPKYRDSSVQRHGVSPTWHHLFELAG